MNYLTGLEWSTGIFGLSIGLLIGCVATWWSLREKVVAADDPFVPLSELPALEEQRGTRVHIETDAPAIPHCNPLIERMYERWIEAFYAGNHINTRRAEIRMISSGITPPTDIDSAERALATLKGDTL